MSDHVPADRLLALAKDALAAEDAQTARAHIEGCSACSASLFEAVTKSRGTEATNVVAGPAPLPADPEDPALKLPRGSNIGRYVLLDRLGTGGMGVVYAAFDPELDRKIAIKILQSHRSGSAGQNWLLREAQAMARLTHPNVIGVHDVGLWNGRVFVAMDLVEGETLRTWMGRPNRSWRETVKAMAAAGRGLAAAHAAGIVHRDFKPENVLVGKDGRVCVLDFGLARAAGQDGAILADDLIVTGVGDVPSAEAAVAVPPPLPGTAAKVTSAKAVVGAPPLAGSPPTDSSAESAVAVLAPPPGTGSTSPAADGAAVVPGGLAGGTLKTPPALDPTAPHAATNTGARQWVSSVLTQAGVVMGTLPYMAPEQLQGRGPDLRSDQFAFAVAAYEALYGQRPFVSEETSNPRRWTLREAPSSLPVPAWLRRVVLRGLALDPNARFASMDELLAALEADPTVNARRSWRAVGAAGLLVAAVGVTWSVANQKRSLCTGAATQASSVWNPQRAERIREAFAATGKPFAASAAASVHKTLDAYASAWTERRTEACEATRVRGDQPETVMALKNGCLDRRLEELGSLASIFEAADAAVVQRASQAAAGLSSLAACADVVALVGRLQPADPTAAASADQISRALATPTAHLRAGSFAKGLEQAGPVVEEARKLGYVPLIAEALLLQGELQLEAGDVKSAERTLLEAAAASQEGRADDVAASTWERLAQTGIAGAKFEAARDAARFGFATLARLGGRDDLRAVLLSTRARVSAADGKYAEALTDATESIRLQQQLYGEEHAATAAAIHTTALAHLRRGELEPSEKLFRQALAIRERVLGANHPDTSASAHGLGSALHSGGRFAEAREQYLRAVAIREVALGEKHSELASTLNNLSALHAMQGQFAEAQPYAERALKILEAVHGPDNAYVAFPVNNLGNFHKEQGRPQVALEYHLRALAIREKNLGAEHTEVAMSLNNVAECYRALGRHKDALELSLRSVAIRDKVLPQGHKDIATSLVGTALSYLKLSRADDAAKAAERAVEIREAAKLADVDVADAKFVLAQALTQARRELPRARALTQQVREVFAAKNDSKRLEEVDRWLASRR